MKNRQKKNKIGKNRNLTKDIRRDWQLYLFLLLPIIYIIVFAYVPMGGLVIAFKDYSMRKGIWGSDWIGFDNFVRFFESYYSWRIIRNTLVLSIYQLLAAFPIPICFALMVNSLKNGKFQKVAQSLANLPYFISVTVMVGIMFQILGSHSGLYGTIVEALTGEYPADLFGNPKAFRHLYVWSGVWHNFGWNSIIYTAALSSVDPSYHEAAQIDGASRFQRILHIDFPCILPTVVITMILRLGSMLNLGFEKAYLMQNSLNLEYSDLISTYVYEVGLAGRGSGSFSYATAIGLFNSVISFILVVAANKISGKLSDNRLW